MPKNVVSVYASKWETYSVDFTTPVNCPRCGLTSYAHISRFGDSYIKLFPEDPYWNLTNVQCSRCGEQFIVEMNFNEKEIEENVTEEKSDEAACETE